MSGTTLLKNLVAATGLPPKDTHDELDRIIQRSGLNADQITLDELRTILSDYLQDILVNASEEFSADIQK